MSEYGFGRYRSFGAALLLVGALASLPIARAQTSGVAPYSAPQGLPPSLKVPVLPCMTDQQSSDLKRLARYYNGAMFWIRHSTAKRDAKLASLAKYEAELNELKANYPGVGNSGLQTAVKMGLVTKESADDAEAKFTELNNRINTTINAINGLTKFLIREAEEAAGDLRDFEALLNQIKENCPPPQAEPPRIRGRPSYSLASNETHVGLFVGGAMVTGLPTASSSGFFSGNLDNNPAAWGVGGSAFIDVAHFGTSPAPFGSATISTGLVVDYFGGASLQYHGGCGGFACTGTGGLSELNYIFEVKATTPLSPGNTLNGYFGAGGATLRPTGQPTGAGGPSFLGSATAPAFRVGWGVDHQIDTNWSAGFKIGVQHTGSTEYDTTLAGERFRIDHKNEVLFGATFTYTPSITAPPPP